MHFRPIEHAVLASLLASDLASRPGIVRVAVDGPQCADPHEFADALVEPLHLLGRPTAHVRAETFWRDASLRLEYGHTDVYAYRHDWLDAAAVRREVLDPLAPGGRGSYLGSLRDPETNRATRERARAAEPNLVLLLSGELLLGRQLPFERTVHLAVSPAARARRTAPDWAWTLSALDEYDAEVRPAEIADFVVKLDDPRHPALSTR